MKLGIIGLPQSGKTTIYNALTGLSQPTGVGGKMEVHTAVVDVPDNRVDQLSAYYNPKKTTYAKVTYIDIAGLEGGGIGDLSGQLRNELGTMDGFLAVIRAFENEMVPHLAGSVDPLRDIQKLEGELLINDQIAIEAKLERLQTDRSKGGKNIAETEREIEVMQKLHEHISEEKALRTLELSGDEKKIISGYQFLTRKPLLLVINLGEGQAELDLSSVTHLSETYIQGELEMEIAQLSPEDAAEFMQEYGIEEPSLNRMISESYKLMGLQSFFTVGDDEVRAWTIKSGTKAQQAAGVVHTDLERGFIRGEVIPWDDLLELKGFAEAKKAAKVQLEGKTYIMRDGDVMNVLFNI
jgi:GTP-binding protein YchF